MSFQKKQRAVVHDSRPQGSKLKQREIKVNALQEAKTPEARKQLKQMNDKVYRGTRTNLTNWFAPNGTWSARGKQTRRK